MNKNEYINVLQLVNSLNIGGLEKVVINIVNNTHNSSNIKFFIVCLEEYGALYQFVNKEISIYQLNKNTTLYLKLLINLKKIIKENKIHIIHCHNYAPLLFSFLLKILFLPKIKIIYTEHNQIFSIKGYHKKIFKYLLNAVNKVVCVSKDLQKHFHNTNICKNSYVIWNGIPNPIIDSAAVERIKNEFKSNNEFLIGTAVVMSHQKGLTYLIKAAKNIVLKYPNIRFLLVGDGPLKEEHEFEVKELNIEKNFKFVGYKKDAINYLKNMDIFILPSLWEGFSIVLLEANAIGASIITTDVGGNKEIINAGKNGLVIPSQNIASIEKTIEKLYLDNVLRESLSRNAVKVFSENFTVNSMVENYIKLYRAI